jgi:hypothetical protein
MMASVLLQQSPMARCLFAPKKHFTKLVSE